MWPKPHRSAEAPRDDLPALCPSFVFIRGRDGAQEMLERPRRPVSPAPHGHLIVLEHNCKADPLGE